MERFDAIVVGGGPAGSTCAWQLRRAGLDVAVIDKRDFPRDKVCAGWVTPAAVETLDQALPTAETIGYPVLVRPSYVLGGRAMEVVQDANELVRFFEAALE